MNQSTVLMSNSLINLLRKNAGTGLSTYSVMNVMPKIQTCTNELADLKKKEIRTAFRFMPLQDREYYQIVLHL